MRQIKFKIWDKEQKKFLEINWEGEETSHNQGTAIINYSDENGLYATLSGYRDEDGWAYEVDAEILAYTGLKDKNGKEIYEGDIVRLNRPELLGLKENLFGVVKFIDGCFDVVSISTATLGRDYLKCYVANHAVKVIGNIYENSERLEGEPQ